MLAHADPFDFDAKYQRSYYAAYISDQNVLAARRACESEGKDVTNYDHAFQILLDQIGRTVLSPDRDVTNLINLRHKYIESLMTLGMTDANKYYSWKLKEQF